MERWLLAAAVLLAVPAVHSHPSMAVPAALGTGLLIRAGLARPPATGLRRPRLPPSALLITLAVGVGVASALLADARPLRSPLLWVGVGAATGLALSATVAAARQRGRLAAALVVAGAIVGAVAGVADDIGFDFDVLLLHEQAADRLVHAASPWRGLTVPDGWPGVAPGTLIQGYVYPPVTLVPYAAAVWCCGDPRWASAAAWVMTAVAVVATLALWRSGDDTSPGPARRTALAGLLVALPAGPYVVHNAWTEPLTVALLAVAGWAWYRHPWVAAAAIGLALASKQYLVVGLPALLWVQWRRRPAHAVLTVATAALATLPLVVPDLAAAWRSLVAFHLDRPPRTDVTTLPGLIGSLRGATFHLPAWMVAGVGTVTASALATRRDAGHVVGLVALGGGLGASFLVSETAFANYWFLVAACALLATVARASAPAHLDRVPVARRRPM